MNTTAKALAARIVAVNDGRLEGRISRSEQAGLLATIEIEMDEAGIMWADIERNL